MDPHGQPGSSRQHRSNRPERSNFHAAARWVDELVRTISAEQWDGPGLGGWNLRGLVGHTSRAFFTLESALDQAAEALDLHTPEDYLTQILSQSGVDEAVLERGIAAGQDLGDAPADTFSTMCRSALHRLDSADINATIMTIGGGMCAGDYVRTRTFELVVHGSDIAAACGLDAPVPDAALGDSLSIGVELALRGRTGTQVLRALTGRYDLPAGFTVLR